MFFVGDGRWLLGAVLFVVANISFGAATVVYYSWLPDLAGPDERDAVSSRGWAFGYVGGALLLGHPPGARAQRRVARPDHRRGGADLPGHGGSVVGRVHGLHGVPAAQPAGPESRPPSRSGFRQLATALREMRAFPLTLWFLGAYLLFNDGVQTVIALSATYATEELGLDQSVLTGAILMVQVVAIAGALGLGRLAGRYGAKRVVLGALVAWIGVLLAAFFLQEGAVGQFYALAAVIGLVQGGTQALSRSLFSQLIPAGKEAEYYGFYEISDRGTSWLGPLAFGLTYQLTGSYRLAIVSLVIFFVATGALAALPIRPRSSGGSSWTNHAAGAPVTTSSGAGRSHPVPLDVPASVPASGDRRRHPAPAHLRFFHGPMDCGKSTLALQVDHNQSRQGRHGLLVTQGDRSAAPQISSRVGLSRAAVEIDGDTDLRLLGARPLGRRAPGRLPDRRRGAVPHRRAGRPAGGARRRVARRRLRLRADHRLPRPAVHRHPAAAGGRRRRPADPGRGAVLVRAPRPAQRPRRRRRDGALGRDRRGRRHRAGGPAGEGTGPPPAVRYQVLCRRHYVRGELGPTPAGPGQLALP